MSADVACRICFVKDEVEMSSKRAMRIELRSYKEKEKEKEKKRRLRKRLVTIVSNTLSCYLQANAFGVESCT